MAAIPLRRALGAVLAGCGAAVGTYAVMGSRDISGPRSVLTDNAIPVAHDEQKMGSQHCDCAPLWECMQTKCRGESCSECATLEQQLRACMSKVNYALDSPIGFPWVGCFAKFQKTWDLPPTFSAFDCFWSVMQSSAPKTWG
jgi:hypothetical protein